MPTFFLFDLCAFSPFPRRSFLHQLMTGVLPFDGRSVAQVVERILQAPAPPIGGGFSEALKMAIARMLEKVFFHLWR
jgi:hypothetical protein